MTSHVRIKRRINPSDRSRKKKMASANELYIKGNESFVADDYESAVQFYTKAIELDGSQNEYYRNRAHAYLKLKNYPEVKSDAEKCLEFKQDQAKVLLWKGIACFNLEEFETARDAFLEGQKYDAADENYAKWLEQCNTKISQLQISASKLKAPNSLPPAPAKIRYDWYQTEVYVNITILIKNAKNEFVKVEATTETLSCKIHRDDAEDFNLDIRLAHPVVPDYCKWKVSPSKVEIQLKKSSGLQWTKLEASPGDAELKQFTPAVNSSTDAKMTQLYPSSSTKKKDWDKILGTISKDEEKDKAEGEAAVNELFQKIYSEGSDDVKKAMNKSFVESGGTVLSTNWGDVSAKKIGVKAPDGMEWKKWES